jgi:hypothetical protein
MTKRRLTFLLSIWMSALLSIAFGILGGVGPIEDKRLATFFVDCSFILAAYTALAMIFYGFFSASQDDDDP